MSTHPIRSGVSCLFLMLIMFSNGSQGLLCWQIIKGYEEKGALLKKLPICLIREGAVEKDLYMVTLG